jgi:hypothetical protein
MTTALLFYIMTMPSYVNNSWGLLKQKKNVSTIKANVTYSHSRLLGILHVKGKSGSTDLPIFSSPRLWS